MRPWIGAALVAGAALGGQRQPGSAPKPLELSPSKYFSEKCARCHGPNGSFYGPDFGKGKSQAQLTKVIKEMAAGPAGAPLAGANLRALVALHTSWIAKAPYVAWLAASKAELSGEKTPASKLQALLGTRKLDISVTDAAWTLKLPARADLRKLRIIAGLGGRTSTLRPSKAPYSSPDPQRKNNPRR